MTGQRPDQTKYIRGSIRLIEELRVGWRMASQPEEGSGSDINHSDELNRWERRDKKHAFLSVLVPLIRYGFCREHDQGWSKNIVRS